MGNVTPKKVFYIIIILMRDVEIDKIVSSTKDGIRFSVRVVPNASKCEFAGLLEDVIKIRLDAPPVEGKANEKCIKFLSKVLRVSKSAVTIISGDKNRNKSIEIKGDSPTITQTLNGLILNSLQK